MNYYSTFHKIGMLCLSLTILSCGQLNQKVDKPTSTRFEELPDPLGKDYLKSWSNQTAGLSTSFVSIDQRFTKSLKPNVPEQRTAELTLWRGEMASAQVLLWSKEDIKDLVLSFSDFKSAGNDKLPAKIAEARFVRYVMTDEFGPGCGWRKPGDFKASLSPDMLDDLSSMDLVANTVRPVWLTVDMPKNAKPGKYSATVFVKGTGIKTQELKLNIQVLNQTLPEATEWSFHLDQWQHPSAVARWKKVPMWSKAHFDALKPQMKMLADAGQKVITTTLNKDPWNVQTQDPYADMIIWTKEKDGSWSYNYDAFDKWVSFMLDLGIKKSINCYSIVPWNNEIHYKDAQTGEFVNVVAKPGTEIFTSLWTPFLKDFSKHLKAKGWLEMTNIALDERNKEEMGAAFDLIEKVAPGLGVAYADNQQTYKRYPNSDDVSTAVQHPIDSMDIVKRKEKGLNTTFYIYCGNNFPNQFTFSDPAESTYLGWFAQANGYNGVLRWAYNSWVENPLQDSRFRTWPAGDTYVTYPDGRSSIRFERMREGIQDFEKVNIIRQQLIAKNDQQGLKKLDQAIYKLRNFKRTPTWNQDLNQAKDVLNQLAQ
ncbi:DUF4091 domain-containing protein [Sphingobacterium kyonggiense]|uniref:DUF4091 domain-containing protein n=1 Tax=Sphingobacterium kyonggiense TaxID=714075 RepID=A0ABP7YYP7_9SPHI